MTKEFQWHLILDRSMRVIENIINKDHADFIEHEMLATWFPWYYQNNTSDLTEGYGTIIDDKTKDHPMLNHTFNIENNITSNHWNLIVPILEGLNKENIKINNIIRIKANLVFPQVDYPNDFYSAPHIDSKWNGVSPDQLTFLYYVNDSDGDTIIFNKISDGKTDPGKLTRSEQYTPLKGTGILFNSAQYHTGSPPKYVNNRVVINFMFDCEY